MFEYDNTLNQLKVKSIPTKHAAVPIIVVGVIFSFNQIKATGTTKIGAVQLRITTIDGVLHFNADIKVIVEIAVSMPPANKANVSSLVTVLNIDFSLEPAIAIINKDMKDILTEVASRGSTLFTTRSIIKIPKVQLSAVKAANPKAMNFDQTDTSLKFPV